MKDNKSSLSLNLNLMNDKTSFEKLEETIKLSIFGVLYLLLKNQDFNIWIEIIFIILQLLQFMAFPFRPMFSKTWKQEVTYIQVSNFLQYFQIVVFFQNNSEMYLIAFYMSICLIVLVILNIIYVAISFSKNKFNLIWPLKGLRSVISFLVSVLFLPIFELLVSIFNCVDPNSIQADSAIQNILRFLEENSTITQSSSNITASAQNIAKAPLVNLYAPSIACWQGSHYIHVIFSLIVSIAFIIICVVVQMTYYETKSSTHNHSAKNSSRSDVFMLFCKITTILIFGFFGDEENEWVIVIVIFFLSAFMFFSYYEERPYYNDKMMKVYLVSMGLYFWNTIVLLMGRILKYSIFDGCLPLFFLGIPIVFALILTNYENKLTILLTNINKFSKGEKVQKQISYFLELVDKKDYDRNSKVLLKGYIYLFEESCTFQDCALKKYIYFLDNNDIDTVAFLLQHAETLYQNGISKFPNCTQLRISYSFFLLERMNKKQQANLELLNTEKYSPKFEEQFIIYRFKKLIEEQANELTDNEENLDIISNIAYKNHLNQFKNCITKVTLLYIDFWSLLLNPNQDNNDDLAKLNDYGSKINILVEEIKNHFEKMQKLKHNDQEVIRCYSDFLNDILNDKEKSNQYRSRLNEIEGSKQNYDDLNLLNLDINALAASDEYQYIILSTQPEKFGMISNVSLGICSMFGYTRTELIGKNIEFAMPEIFHKGHRNILQEKINEYKKSILNIQNVRNFKPNFKDIFSFGKNKSRYLVPFNFKVTMLPTTEQNDGVFLAKISQDIYNLSNNHNQQVCYVLTNTSFIIQNFTANSINILGMNSNAINNGNMEITRFIREFQEEFIKYNDDIKEKTSEEILFIKRQIANNKFKNPIQIAWKKADDGSRIKSTNLLDLNYEFDKFEINTPKANYMVDLGTKLNKPNNTFLIQKEKCFTEENLILTIQDIILLGKLEAFIFKFESIINSTPNDLIKDFEFMETTKEPIIDRNTQFLKNISNPNSNLNNLDISKEIINQINTSNPSKRPINDRKEFKPSLIEDTIRIDKSFLPNNASTFFLDPKKLSYMVNPKNINQLRDVIKEEANKKLRKNEVQSIEEEGDGSEYTSGSYSSQEISGEYVSDSGSEVVTSEFSSNRKKQHDDYYRISFSNFKFLIYDPKKDSLVEVLVWEKHSQVEYKKNEDYKKKEIIEVKTEDNRIIKENKEIGEEELVDNQGKEGILIKQIEFALSKEETQPTITRMKWISFFIFIIYIGITSVFLAFFLDSINYIIENVTLVYDSYDLIQNTLYGIYHTRELVLLNNDNYKNIYQEKSIYISNNTDKLLELFSSSHDIIIDIITTFLVFSEKNDYLLRNSTIFTHILQDDLSIKSFNLTLSSLFVEANTALYHVAHLTIQKIIQTNKDVFFFIFNSLNDITIELLNHALLYIDELSINSRNFKLLFLYIFIGAVVFGIITYILIASAYMAVGKRKESYLEVFFEIGGSVIKNSLEKCENFSKKIISDIMSDEASNLDDEELGHETLIQPLNTANKKTVVGKKRKTNSSKETRIVKLKILLGILYPSLFFFLVYFFFQNYLAIVEIYTLIFKNTCLEQTEYLMLFNTLREYFFDRTSYVNRKVVSSFIDEELKNIYSFKSDREIFVSTYQNYFPNDYAKLFLSIKNENVCPYATDYFEKFFDGQNCEKFVSNSSSYGLNILLTNYVEEIRYAKYKFDLILENTGGYEKIYTYNNTLHMHSLDPSLKDENYTQNDPFQIFNDPSHKNLVIMNRYLLRSAFAALKVQLKTSIKYSLDSFQTLYIIIFCIFFLSLAVLYIFIWRPFENGLNQTIYKTKNMLSIIPKEVLASLSNINKLLDIGQNFSNNKRANKN